MSRTSHSPTTSRQRGFTMIELMVVIAIVAILGALAAPTFTPIMERWRVRGATDDVKSAIYLARSEAIKRGGGVEITRNESSGDCSSTGPTDWKCGWAVSFVAGGVTTPISNTGPTSSTDITFTGTSGTLSIDRWGVITDAGVAIAPSLEIVPKGKTVSDTSALKVCVGLGGRVSTVKGSASC